MKHDLAGAVRNAVALGEFAKARKLWEQYAGQLRAAIQTGSASREMMEEARKTVEWCGLTAKAYRAQASYVLASARIAQAYRGVETGTSHYVRTCG